MGKRLARGGLHPDLICASPAKRALDTALIIAKQLGYERGDIRIDRRLYATSARALMQLVRGFKRRISGVVLCGHNPELHSLAQRLGSTLEELPTCGVVELLFEARGWSAVGKSMLIRATGGLPEKALKKGRRLVQRP